MRKKKVQISALELSLYVGCSKRWINHLARKGIIRYKEAPNGQRLFEPCTAIQDYIDYRIRNELEESLRDNAQLREKIEEYKKILFTPGKTR